MILFSECKLCICYLDHAVQNCLVPVPTGSTTTSMDSRANTGITVLQTITLSIHNHFYFWMRMNVL